MFAQLIRNSQTGDAYEIDQEVKRLAYQLVEITGMRLFFKPNDQAETTKDKMHVIYRVLDYLNQEHLKGKVPTPRMLGAFSFCVSNTDDLYIDQKHFVFLNPKYVNVYASFGGLLSVPIDANKPLGMKLSDKFSTAMIDIRQDTFGPEILELLGSDSAYYDFPVPHGDDFKLMDEETLDAYISTSIGPRMLFDETGEINLPIITKILAQCELAPLISRHIRLFPQISANLGRAAIDVDMLKRIALFVGDNETLNSINRYGRSFRLGWMSATEIDQVLGLPNAVTSAEVKERFILSILRSDGSVDYEKLIQRTRQITSTEVLKRYTELAFICNNCQTQTIDIDGDYRDYSLTDIFTYISGDTLYVTTTKNIPFLSISTAEGIDGEIVNAAIAKWIYIEEHHLVFPPRPVKEMVELLIDPQGDLIELLNARD